MHYGKHVSKNVPQSEKADERQVKNNAGGFSFKLDKWGVLDRFLILGSEKGTYYVGEKKLTMDNAKNLLSCLDSDPVKTVETIASISESGRAPKNDPAVFALALAASHTDNKARQAALAALPRVCRIGTHLFHFAQEVSDQRGWGRGLRNAIAAWYQRDLDKVAYDMLKYQQRDGWSHKDLLRLSHATPLTVGHDAMFRYVSGGGFDKRSINRNQVVKEYAAIDRNVLPDIIEGFDRAKSLGKSPKELAQVIRSYGLTHEMIPTEGKNHLVVWEALAEKMPITAMIRNLGKMSQIGLLDSSEWGKKVSDQITNQAILKKGRVHPLQVLVALKVYQQGHGEKGKLSWVPNKKVTAALDEAFYLAFGAIEPTGKRTMLALDVSGSMTMGLCGGMTGISPRIGSAAMAMATARVEKDWSIVGFTSGTTRSMHPGYDTGLSPLKISPNNRLDDIVKYMDALPFGGTDCALPMVHAKKNNMKVDTFVVYTDNETWAGNIHPHKALEEYRQHSGIPAKLIVVGMTSTEFTIANPSDGGMLDVVGFDTAAPNVMSQFARD